MKSRWRFTIIWGRPFVALGGGVYEGPYGEQIHLFYGSDRPTLTWLKGFEEARKDREKRSVASYFDSLPSLWTPDGQDFAYPPGSFASHYRVEFEQFLEDQYGSMGVQISEKEWKFIKGEFDKYWYSQTPPVVHFY